MRITLLLLALSSAVVTGFAPFITPTLSRSSVQHLFAEVDGIVVTGTNIDMTEALTAHATSTLSSALSKTPSLTSRTHCTLSVSKNPSNRSHKCEVTIRVANGPVIRACTATTDMYASIVEAGSIVRRKVRKFKERRNTGAHSKVDIADFLIDNDQDDDISFSSPSSPSSDPYAGEVTKVKSFDLRHPISLSEAVFALDYVDHDFYVFRSEESGEVEVVYKRNGGGVGLIQQE
eukprot:CAMPEP_0182464400 /NCGR_PEP_ID=MMETSP1319-20130603/8607_1 /TAXON_ID=172717 /ORGANISM="Bolidomonas pacifica, Strain RCC208" /LENGTH=232 /DNA_ID=CAMNT_0024664041 /DNA_START=53 /DNA_END=751 /DNA_ORIENTATION=+